MDRREVLKASLASAAAIGITSKRAVAAAIDSAAGADGQAGGGQENQQPVLASVYDYETAAKRKMSLPAWEYFNSGSADEITLRRNREALDELRLKPRVLVDVTRIDTSCTVLGYKLPHPILLAPTSSHLLAHPDAETATARGAGEAKTIMVASTALEPQHRGYLQSCIGTDLVSALRGRRPKGRSGTDRESGGGRMQGALYHG